MTLTPANLIADAVLAAHPYTPTQALALGPLLRQLTGLDTEVVNWYSIQAPERIAVSATDLTVTMAANLAGYPLEAARSYSRKEREKLEGPKQVVEAQH